jgi:hypothetical protein
MAGKNLGVDSHRPGKQPIADGLKRYWNQQGAARFTDIDVKSPDNTSHLLYQVTVFLLGKFSLLDLVCISILP